MKNSYPVTPRQKQPQMKPCNFQPFHRLISPNESPTARGSQSSLRKRDDQSKGQRKSLQKSLCKWKSNPQLLMTNSYIKLGDVESFTLENLAQNFEKQETERKRLTSAKSVESNFFSRPQKRIGQKNQQKFLKISSNNGKGERNSIIEERGHRNGKEENLEKTVEIKEKEIEILKNELELLKKTLDSKNRKVKEYERLMQIVKKQNSEKVSHLQKEIHDLQNRLLAKQKENKQFQCIIDQSTKENQTLTKRIQELLMSQSSFFKQAPISFNLGEQSDFIFEMTSTGENLGSLNELEDEIYQKNVQIYDLKKNIEKMHIKEHYLEAKHEQNIKRVMNENHKKYRDLMNCYQRAQQELKKLKWKCKPKNQELDLNYSQSEIDFFFEP